MLGLNPRFPLKGSFKGDTDTGVDMDLDMDIDSDMAVSISWGSFKESYRTSLRGIMG